MTHYIDLLFTASRVSVIVASWIVVLWAIVSIFRWRSNGINYAKLTWELTQAHSRVIEAQTKQIHEMWSLMADDVAHHGQELQLQRDLLDELRQYRNRCDEIHRVVYDIMKVDKNDRMARP